MSRNNGEKITYRPGGTFPVKASHLHLVRCYHNIIGKIRGVGSYKGMDKVWRMCLGWNPEVRKGDESASNEIVAAQEYKNEEGVNNKNLRFYSYLAPKDCCLD